MTDFRKSLFVLAALILMLGTTAFAQTSMQCQNNAGVPPILRAEGLTDLTGDIVLNCTGGVPTAVGATIPQTNIQVFLNTPVTSRQLTNTVGATLQLAEAVLILDDQAPATQFLCAAATGCTFAGTGGVVTAYSAARPSVYQGQVNTTDARSVLFLGVPIDPPGSTGVRVVRITNIRTNATGLTGGSGVPFTVQALISASPQNVLPINTPTQAVGYVLPGLTFSTRNVGDTGGLGTPAFAQCASNNNSGTTRNATGLLRFEEGFATAFKTRAANFDPTGATSPVPAAQNIPGVTLTAGGITASTETGFYNPALGAVYGTAGLADYGTRLQAVFNAVPAGVQIFVSVLQNTPTSSATAKAVLLNADTGAFSPAAPQATTAIYLSNGVVAAGGTALVNVDTTAKRGVATWEVTASNALVLERLDFSFYFVYTASVANSLPEIGTGTVVGKFAPVSTVTTGALGNPVPRFGDKTASVNLYTIRQCITNLMFPFVTNQAGFDTGIAIANTTTDPFGTAAQTNTCALNFYGANAPSVYTTPAVAAGTVWSDLASTRSPNFQGYIIAQCKFQYAHGFAFVSDLGARTIAMGYLALVMPDQGRPNSGTTPGLALATGTGEVLGN